MLSRRQSKRLALVLVMSGFGVWCLFQCEPLLRTKERLLCPPAIPTPGISSTELVNLRVEPLTTVGTGGWFRPENCLPRNRVAVLVPYRNREIHLNVFLTVLHHQLSKQNIEYRIFVVEQAGSDPFNRAKLLNVGYMESKQIGSFDCFVFHDVDLIPEDSRNVYDCPQQNPRHMSVAVSTLGYKLEYKDLFGGVSVLTQDQMEQVNGFSNLYWGWGSEDNDMYKRLRHHGYQVERRSVDVARYMMLPHQKADPNPKRFDLFSKWRKRTNKDGLSSLQYNRLSVELKPLYTWILVDLLWSQEN